MKHHLKRQMVPVTWPILKKEGVFITRPYPVSHGFFHALPLALVFNRLFKITNSTKESEKLLLREEVLIDGKRRENKKHSLGLFDILSLPKVGESYRLSLSEQGQLALVPLKSSEDKVKPCTVVRKVLVKGSQMQLTLHDGRTLLTSQPGNVGDTLIIEVPSGRVKKRLEMKDGACVFLVKGKGKGKLGQVQSLQGDKITYKDEHGTSLTTLRKYAVVVGETKPEVTVR